MSSASDPLSGFTCPPEVRSLESNMVDLRRHFHQYPELMYQEFDTSERVASELEALGLRVTRGVGKTGVVAVIEGKKPCDDSRPKCVMLRADMDALPVTESSDKPYKSKNDGVMHACGHDGHMSILLTVATILAKNRERFCNTIKLVFQPAEEGGAGAKAMIEDGVLENPHVDVVYGLHLWNFFDLGRIVALEGPHMGGVARYSINIIGQGGHTSSPQACRDPVAVSAHAILALQALPARIVDPIIPSALAVGVVQGGTADNVIPGSVLLKGTVRTATTATEDRYEEEIQRLARGLSDMFDVKAEVDFRRGYPTVVNTTEETQLVHRACEKVLGPKALMTKSEETGLPLQPCMAGEDFSFYLQKRPGCFFFVGCNTPGKPVVPHHRHDFDVDERSLSVGAAMFLKIVDDVLGE